MGVKKIFLFFSSLKSTLDRHALVAKKRECEYQNDMSVCVFVGFAVLLLSIQPLPFCVVQKCGTHKFHQSYSTHILALGKLNVLLQEYMDVLMRFYCKS